MTRAIARSTHGPARAARRAAPRLWAVLSLALASCTSSEEGANDVDAPAPLAGTLSVDVRGSMTIRIGERGGGTIDVTMQLATGEAADLFDASAPIVAPGRIDAFPEANTRLFSATTIVAGLPAGRCKGQPVALALALHQRGTDARVAGALTAYCGERHAGTPAKVLRLSGQLAR